MILNEWHAHLIIDCFNIHRPIMGLSSGVKPERQSQDLNRDCIIIEERPSPLSGNSPNYFGWQEVRCPSIGPGYSLFDVTLRLDRVKTSSLGLGEGGVESAKSLEQGSLGGGIGERQSLDDLGSFVGGSLDGHGGDSSVGGRRALLPGLGAVSGQVSHVQVEHLSE